MTSIDFRMSLIVLASCCACASAPSEVDAPEIGQVRTQSSTTAAANTAVNHSTPVRHCASRFAIPTDAGIDTEVAERVFLDACVRCTWGFFLVQHDVSTIIHLELYETGAVVSARFSEPTDFGEHLEMCILEAVSSSSISVRPNSSAATQVALPLRFTAFDGGGGRLGLGLSDEQIHETIQENIEPFVSCFQQLIDRQPGSQGTFTTRFVITPAGDVGEIASGTIELGDDEMERCMFEALRRMTFNQPEGADVVVVTYPFEFVFDPAR